ncbi:RES family NAD+ phosphorylase [Spirosoma litoris]
MILFRIASTPFIDDLTGKGAFLHGGRWNRPGLSVLYAATNPSSAAMETLAHLKPEIELAKDSYSCLKLWVPATSIYDLGAPSQNWTGWPNWCPELWEETDYWLNVEGSLCMKVPSAISGHENNYLINPAHELARRGKIKVLDKSKYVIDKRLLGKTNLTLY